MTDFSVKFVSKKISKIRWRPKSDVKSSPSTIFVTGSWDDHENTICVWDLKDRIAATDDRDVDLLDHEPQKSFEIFHSGDVLDMQYLSSNTFAVASSSGAVSVVKHSLTNETLTYLCTWENLHHFKTGSPASCTCLAPKGDDWIASAGEDGRIVIVALDQRQPVQTIERADSCTINGLTYLKQSELLTVNSFGQLKTFDLRQDSRHQAQIFSVTENHTPLLCLDKHPGQAHIVATGGEDGMLTIWDLRQEKFPMTLLEAHTGATWEVKFHPHNPNHLFTCSDDGSLWHWDGSSFSADVSSFPATKGKDSKQGVGIVSPWLSLETSRHKLDIASLLPNKSLPVNSLDIQSSTLLCSTDSETIYSIHLPLLD